MKGPKVGVPAAQAIALLAKLGIKSVPVPLEKIGSHLGARIQFSPLDPELSGMIFIRENIPVIGVNSTHHPNRQRFSLAHEFGHLVLHRHALQSVVHVDKKFPFLLRDSKSATGTDKLEIEANQFAAELLMPEAVLIKALEKYSFDIDDDAPLQDLAKRFRVSTQAMAHRIENILGI